MANCQTRPQDLLLGELRVVGDAPRPETRAGRLLRVLTRQQQKPVNYQGRGLGSSLLSHIIRRATEKRFHRITGNLFPHDLRANPNLPGWYRHFGFAVEMQAPEQGTITLDLPASGLAHG